MRDSEDKIHVMPVAPNDWEIEVQTGDAVAHELDKERAVAVALDVARAEGIETVIVHDGDGVTEELHSTYNHSKTTDADLDIPSPS